MTNPMDAIVGTVAIIVVVCAVLAIIGAIGELFVNRDKG